MKPLLSTLLLASALAAEPTKPNILFIMSDDHAAQAIGCYGSTMNKTPHMDRLAAGGMRFDRMFVTNSICSPSRATILTGKYSHLNGVPAFNRFDGTQQTVAKLLQSAGYHTGMIGKWHLGSDPTGFDVWNILPGQGVYVNPTLLTAAGPKVYPGYCTEIINELSLDFLKNRPKDKPFFLMCHHKAPHREWTPAEKYRKAFENVIIPEPSTLRDDYATRGKPLHDNQQRVFDDMTRRDLKLTPPADLPMGQRQAWLNAKPKEVVLTENGVTKTLQGKELESWKYQRYMRDYLACVQSVDDSVGSLTDYLDANGLKENTLVIYTSDQGFFLGEHGLYDKRFMYEPSLRMPFLVRYPAVIKPGQTTQAMGINADFAPTFLNVAGLPVPPDMQGKSLLPVLKGETPADWRKSVYYRYYHDPGDHRTAAHYGVRTDTHKLIYFWKLKEYELYDLKADPEEMKNLAGDPKHADILKSLQTELARLKAELKDDDQFATEMPNGGVNPKKKN